MKSLDKQHAQRDRLGSLELLVLLSIIRSGDEAYGLGITTMLMLAGVPVSIGAVYTTVERLQKKGMVQCRKGKSRPVRGGRARHYYTLTEVGRKAVRESYRGIQNLVKGSSV